MDISNDKLGVTWSTTEAPLLELGGLTANLPRSQPNPKVYLWQIEPAATIYSWVMNNHWHTNYRADQEGETVFHYAIRPHAEYDQTAAAHFGVESTEPLLAAPAAGPAPAGSLVEISPGSIMITSLKPSTDGQGHDPAALQHRRLGGQGKAEVGHDFAEVNYRFRLARRNRRACWRHGGFVGV